MLRYRFGFPGIFFLFNVWWGDKFNRQNQSIIYFAIEIRFINFRYWSYYLTRTQGKPVENWGGKFLWSEVALFDVSVFLSDPLFDIPSYFDQTGFSIPEFFLITPVIWLWALVPVILDQTTLSFLRVSTKIPLVSGRCVVSLPTLQLMRDTSTILKVTKCQS